MVALVVDDDEAMLALLSRFLKKEGWSVVPADGAAKALESLRAGRFDAAFLDVDLGYGCDGIELAQELRRLLPGLPVVIMSGEPANRERAAEARFERFLPKPFALHEARTLAGSCLEDAARTAEGPDRRSVMW